MKPLVLATLTSIHATSLLTAIASLIGVAVLIVPTTLVNAIELPRSRVEQTISQPAENTSNENPTTTLDANRQSASPLEAPKKPISERIQQDDQVSITDVPTECRSYFSGSPSISLFDYYQGIERCRHGR